MVGHFAAAHEGERFKPTETMWLPSEVWDDLARENNQFTRRGAQVNAIGNLLSSKWVDKATGEERKQFRFRISKFLNEKDFKMLSDSVGPKLSNADEQFTEMDDYPR